MLGLEVPAYEYSKEKDARLFPATTVETNLGPNMYSRKEFKKEKKSFIARMKRHEAQGKKIGVIYALQKACIEYKITNANGQTETIKADCEKLDQRFYDLGQQMVAKLNEKFGVQLFELIDIHQIPREKREVKKLYYTGGYNKLKEEDITFPAFEKTQYPIIVSYKVEGNVRESQKYLSSRLYIREYMEGTRTMLGLVVGRTGGFLEGGTLLLSEIEVAPENSYGSQIDDLNAQEDEALGGYVQKEEEYYQEKIKK